MKPPKPLRTDMMRDKLLRLIEEKGTPVMTDDDRKARRRVRLRKNADRKVPR